MEVIVIGDGLFCPVSHLSSISEDQYYHYMCTLQNPWTDGMASHVRILVSILAGWDIPRQEDKIKRHGFIQEKTIR